MSALAIEVHDLRMRYGADEAVRGIDLEVGRGEVFGFLVPNGAGKTMQRAVTGAGGGTGLTAHNVALLVAWGAAGLVLAARRFQWVPQGVGA